MHRGAIIVALLCASNAPLPALPASHDIVSGPGTIDFDGWPPGRYLREMEFRWLITTYDRVQVVCRIGAAGPLPPGREYAGCHRNGLIVTFMPSRGDGEHFARIIAHEMAHHGGWSATHPI